MKKLLLLLGVAMLAGNVNAGELNEDAKVKHPKKRSVRGVTIVRDDYVKTHNPKRLHWNDIHNENNLVSSSVQSSNPKRIAMVKASEQGRTDAGSPQATFVERKRKHL